jgi:TctA family transporter
VTLLLALAAMLVPALLLLFDRPRLASVGFLMLFGLASCANAREGAPISAAINLAFGLVVSCVLFSFPATHRRPTP